MKIVAYCNAVENFLPPIFIVKGVNKKTDVLDRLELPRKSAVNPKLFQKWLVEHFVLENFKVKACCFWMDNLRTQILPIF